MKTLHESITASNLKHYLEKLSDDTPFENIFLTDPNDEVFNQPLKK